ncbi:MAG: amino acid adenylation domain-containing protein, partial [Kiritimatiellales bacterium]|nr:amino acid adenylation domain-containing protein [Kiritimatiellales bacterium]
DGASIYNIVWGYTIDGALDVDLFRSCVDTIVRRHDVLRSTYKFENDEPMRVVAPFTPVEVPLIDTRGREAEIKRQQREEAAAPIDIRKGPLWNVKLYQTAEAQFDMIWKIHHIIADGWSGGNFMSELQELYSAAVEGRPAELPELKIRYGDYAVWQRSSFEAGQSKELSNYWKNKLENFQTLELPHDRPRTVARTTKGEVVLFDFPKPLQHLVRKRSHAEDVTPFMTLLAAFKVMMARYSGQEDIIIGTPVANRSPTETEPVIGLFLNNVVLRTDVARDISFRELLQRVKQTALDAFAHQELSFERVVELLNVTRDTSLPPLYQVMLSLNNYPYPQLKLGELPTREAEVDNGLAQTDMWFAVDDDELGMRGSVSYNSDLFDRATIKRMADHFENVLQNACADPSLTVSRIPLFSKTERERILVEWNATQTDHQRDKCTHQLIEEQVEKSPDAPAILFEGTSITYAEMNARANRLAHLLIERGVKAESKVCVCLERGPELVITELAIWKAGGAYVPLDPIYPPDRIAYMIGDSDSVLLVTEISVAGIVNCGSCITLDGLDLSAYPDKNPSVGVSSGNLAYMIYTSGSTGNPKGVQIAHRPFVNFLLSMQRQPGLTPDDTLLAITTPCFDIAGLELYLPLITGARVAILPQETVMNGRLLAEQIDKTGTVLQATPATWRMLLNSGWQGAPHLKMLCGGEGWPRELADALLAGGGELWNMYGPTETTVWSSIEEVRRGDQGSVSIGRPIANTSLYILDDELQAVPIGVTGELWIGGEGLSCGYYKREGLTQSAFVPDPFRPGERMYKTGDLASRLPDGRVECLGRVDFQVKVRGFRIELEEIEKVMERHAGVKQAVANAYQGPDGNNQLAGYFQCLENSEVDISSLRNLLKESLPDYMVPLTFVELDEIPLTPNGKVNRKALPDPDASALAASEQFVAPRTPDERALAQIWKEVLNLDRVGVRDNFFELGGHSLLAIRLIDRLAESGYTLRVEQLFQYPVIEEMIPAMHSNFAVESDDLKWSSLVTLKRGNENNVPLFFLHTAPGDVLMYANLVHHLKSDQPCYGFQSLGLHDLDHMHNSIEAMAAHYVGLLTEFYPTGPYLLAGWCYGGTIAAEMAVQLKEQGLEVSLLALFDAWAHVPIDKRLRKQYNRERWKAFMTLSFDAKKRLVMNRIVNRFFVTQKAEVARELEIKVAHGVLKNRDEVYKRNMDADWNYYARYYPGKVNLFRPDLLNSRFLPDLSMGWHSLVDDYELFLIPGDHRGLMHEPNAQILARHLQNCMDEVLAD